MIRDSHLILRIADSFDYALFQSVTQSRKLINAKIERSPFRGWTIDSGQKSRHII